MNDFIKEGVQVGDRLYSVSYGWGTVLSIDNSPAYPICIQFENSWATFTESGQLIGGENQCLFWSEPKFEIPAKPKREVVKEVEVFINYLDPNTFVAFKDQAAANANKTPWDTRYKGKLIFTVTE